jgi:hypothetical protein
MAPNCALADVKADSAMVMSSSQGIFQIRDTVAQLTGLPPDKVRVQYYPGSNTYGLSCYTDVGEAAAIMSHELGKPVRVQLSRQDEFGWDNYGPAHLADMRGAIDANGKIVAFEYQAWGYDGNGVGTASRLLALGPSQAGARGGGGGARGGGGGGRGGGATPAQGGSFVGGLYQIRISQNDMYDVENRRLIEHRLDGRGYLKLGPLRAPLDPPYFFAQEGMIDELAYLAKLDPWEFRKRNISDRRWLGVLEAAANAAKWTPSVAASKVSSARVVTGRGIAVGTHHLQPNQGDRITYAAAVVDIEVNKDNGRVIAKHVYGAMDCGLAINPGIVESQIVGMSVHGTSLALKEELQFNQTNVTSLDWNSYQTLRFGEHPAVTPIVVQQLNEKSTGAGEEVLPAVVGAIGNAFFDATGVRLRQFPLTPRRVLAALKSGGRPPAAPILSNPIGSSESVATSRFHEESRAAHRGNRGCVVRGRTRERTSEYGAGLRYLSIPFRPRDSADTAELLLDRGLRIQCRGTGRRRRRRSRRYRAARPVRRCDVCSQDDYSGAHSIHREYERRSRSRRRQRPISSGRPGRIRQNRQPLSEELFPERCGGDPRP